MCGRYTLQQAEAIRRLIESLTGEPYDQFMARYNVAPTQVNPVVRSAPSGRPRCESWRWGMPPAGNASGLHVNARSEDVLARPAFRDHVQRRRCVVPADGFYEWQRPDARTRVPHLFSLRERRPFFMAGIHDEGCRTGPANFVVLTCGPNRLMAGIHDRMPVILSDSALARWLEPGPLTAADIAALCVPPDDQAMQAWPVGEVVNHARNDSPECVVPVSPRVDPQGTFGF